MDSLKATNLFSVDGLIAVITGGATGIGLMMTKTLIANGAKKIYVVGRRKEKLDEAASLFPDIIIPLVADVTSKDDLKRIASQVESEVGYINLLICNSGIIGPNVPVLPGSVGVEEYAEKAFDMDMDLFTKTQETNVTAALWTGYAFLTLLDKGNRSGYLDNSIKSQIIVTSSIAAYNRLPATPIGYKVSKAAAAHMAKNMSSTFGAYDIRANAIAPGLFQSELASGLINMGIKDKSKKSHEEGSFEKSNIPLGRTGREEEMGGTILYLCSRAGGFCTGTIIVMDGGRLNLIPGY